MRCVLYIKNVQQKFEGLMFGPIYIVGLSILFHSTGPTSLRGPRYCNGKGDGQEIYFCIAY